MALGIAPRIKIAVIYYHSIKFHKPSMTNGKPDPICRICGFSLSNHTTIKVVDDKDQTLTIHYAHIEKTDGRPQQ